MVRFWRVGLLVPLVQRAIMFSINQLQFREPDIDVPESNFLLCFDEGESSSLETNQACIPRPNPLSKPTVGLVPLNARQT